MPRRLHARIAGTVQGVGFREFTRRTAQTLELTGWVRNRPDGSVELVAEGPEERLDQLIAAVRAGPRGSAVTDVSVDWSQATNELPEFSVRF
ncbi:acylphosphatase [bacterium]|nr:acylphosphatase [bacterium]